MCVDERAPFWGSEEKMYVESTRDDEAIELQDDDVAGSVYGGDVFAVGVCADADRGGVGGACV